MATDSISRVSPSLFSRLERCGLAEAMSRQRSTGGARPSRPAARLGTAAHQVLEAFIETLMSKGVPNDLRTWIREEWRLRTHDQQMAAALFEEERALGTAEGWPGYYDIEARLTIEAARLAAEAPTWDGGQVLVEKWLQDDSLGLEGKPDLVLTGDPGRLVDFKSGRPTASDVQPGTSYANQIAIYAALLRSSGFAVDEAVIQPLGLAPLRVAVSAHDESSVTERARFLATRFNHAIAVGSEVDLAAPSDEHCTFCPHATHCPALWAALGTFVDMYSVEGDVTAVKRTARGLSLKLLAEHGTVVGSITIVQLRPVGPLADVAAADRLRLSGLARTDNPDVLSVPRGGWLRVSRLDPGP